MTGTEPAVLDDRDSGRFVVTVDGSTAELDYRRRGNRLVLVHTEVPEAIGGRGIAGRLTAAAVETAQREGLVVVPLCPYARAWLRDHPAVASTVTVDWPKD
jgi:predicted GNAT family acetyltransferase